MSSFVKRQKLPADKERYIKLDYNRGAILLYGGSKMHAYRAQGCRKEPETVKWIEEYVRRGDVFYDVGANVGAYSLVACAHCSGKLKVHAFEPSYPTYYYLCRNVILNGYEEHIIPHPIALSQNTGTGLFNYSSLESGCSMHFMEGKNNGRGLDFAPVYRQQILHFNIDHLIKYFNFPIPNHIKLDVDGSELDILKGATKTLNDPHTRSILVETSDTIGNSDAITELLTKKGFRLASRRERGGGISNCIFERR